MKERPILFSAPMVLALLAGTKTQTRRVLSTQPLDVLPFKGKDKGRLWTGLMHRGETIKQNRGNAFRCRFGAPGDRLWVRETWALNNPDYEEQDREDAKGRPRNDDGRWAWYRATDGEVDGGWRPNIFMPRWASRITLEVTGVRVERLQDISEADAVAEGFSPYIHESWSAWDPTCEATVSLSVKPTPEDIAKHGYEHVRHIGPKVLRTAREAFLVLWDSLHGDGAAAKNPWVWCTSFKRVQP